MSCDHSSSCLDKIVAFASSRIISEIISEWFSSWNLSLWLSKCSLARHVVHAYYLGTQDAEKPVLYMRLRPAWFYIVCFRPARASSQDSAWKEKGFYVSLPKEPTHLCVIAERAHPPLCKSSGTVNRSHSQHFCWQLELSPRGTMSFLINTQLYKICGTVFLEFHHIFSYHQIIPGCKINTWKHNSFSF